jgi:hypothetical protein
VKKATPSGKGKNRASCASEIGSQSGEIKSVLFCPFLILREFIHNAFALTGIIYRS